MENVYPQPALSSLSFTDAEIRFHYGNQIFSEPDSINKSAAFSSWHGKKTKHLVFYMCIYRYTICELIISLQVD